MRLQTLLQLDIALWIAFGYPCVAPKHLNFAAKMKGQKIMIIAIDHGYYAIKTKHFSFPAGITAYSHEPYTKQGVLQYGGKYYVCGTGRQPIQRTKTETENYYLLTLAAIAQEIKYRKASRRSTPRECLRLQGWKDDRIDTILAAVSDSQAYKQAGNGVTTTVVEAIGRRLATLHAELHGGDIRLS